jgi:hypothetical protein
MPAPRPLEARDASRAARRALAAALLAALLAAAIAAGAGPAIAIPRPACGVTLDAGALGASPYPGAALERALRRSSGRAPICLTAGLPAEIDLFDLHPPRPVTVEPAPGVAAAAVGSYFDLRSVSNVRLVGMTLSFLIYGDSTDDSVTGSAINGTSVIRDTPRNARITIADDTARGVHSNADSAVFTVEETGRPNCPDGVTIEHNLVAGTNEDGLGTMGDACGTRFVANVVEGIVQSRCGPIHCDGFQDNGGGIATVLAGNLFYDDTDCWLLDDGSSGVIIDDNVCATAGDSTFWMQFGGAQTLTLDHDTVTSTVGAAFGDDHQGDRSSNVTFSNDIFYSAPVQNAGQPVPGLRQRDNLCGNGCNGGTGERSGRPRLVGGAQPVSWAGFALAPGSRGVRAASDGGNLGVSDFATVPGPADATAVRGGQAERRGSAAASASSAPSCHCGTTSRSHSDGGPGRTARIGSAVSARGSRPAARQASRNRDTSRTRIDQAIRTTTKIGAA